MKKFLLALLLIVSLCSASVLTGCTGGSDYSEKDLFEADAWDYDGDGKLNDKELNDYGDFYQDAYDYAY